MRLIDVLNDLQKKYSISSFKIVVDGKIKKLSLKKMHELNVRVVKMDLFFNTAIIEVEKKD